MLIPFARIIYNSFQYADLIFLQPGSKKIQLILPAAFPCAASLRRITFIFGAKNHHGKKFDFSTYILTQSLLLKTLIRLSTNSL